MPNRRLLTPAFRFKSTALNALVEHCVNAAACLLFFSQFLLPTHFRHLLFHGFKIDRLRIIVLSLFSYLRPAAHAGWSSSQDVIQGRDGLLLSSDLTQPGQCPFLVARPCIDGPQIDDRHTVIRLMLQGFQQSLTGPVQLALLHVRVPQIAQQVGVPARGQRAQVVVLGVFESPFLVSNATQHVQGVRVLGINLQCCFKLDSGIDEGIFLKREITSLQKRIQTRHPGGIEILPRAGRPQIGIAILAICNTAGGRVDVTTTVAPWRDVSEAVVKQRQLAARQSQEKTSREAEVECAHLGNHPWLK